MGKGFSALMGDRPNAAPESDSTRPLTSSSGTFAELALSSIEPDPEQPRRIFVDQDITQLASSLETHGLLEPIVVHQTAPSTYQIIAGERRYRAARQLGWERIPALIRRAHDQSNLILALVENLQREDLSALEEAQAYQRLRDDHQLTQDRIAQLVGKRRATIANSLRLLTLGDATREALAKGLIDKGHARALLGINDPQSQAQALTRCVKEGWSVRATEHFVKNQSAAPQKRSDSTKTKTNETDETFSALSSAIGLDVNLSGRTITLRAKNRDEARLFLSRLTRMVRGN